MQQHYPLTVAGNSSQRGMFMPAASDTAYNPGLHTVDVLMTAFTAVGQPIMYPDTASPEIHMMRVTMPSGKETGWHVHPVPAFIFVAAGTLTVSTAQSHREYTAGEGFAEAIHIPHNGENLGEVPVDMIVLFLGIRGQASTLRACCNM